MIALFGASVTSPVTVLEKMRGWAKENKVLIRMYRPPEAPATATPEHMALFKKAHMLLFNTYSDFRSVLATGVLQKRSVVVCVFDSPLFLAEIEGLQFLDIDRKHSLSYTFKFQDINYTPVKRACLRAVKAKASKKVRKSVEHVPISPKKIDLLPTLIKEQKQGSLTAQFNPIFYSLDHQRRTRFIKHLTDFLFGTTKEKKFVTRTMSLFKKKRGLVELFEELLSFLRSPKGQNFAAALQAAEKTKIGKPTKEKEGIAAAAKKVSVQYAKLGQKFGVDGHELAYLNRLRRQLKNLKSYALDDAATDFRAKHPLKKPGTKNAVQTT